ncbi:hypothetical protein M3Y94_00478000 [Aphelenchoides besseyi]|nr:hypothetical protein M3Y94_00478000 [Aphelenchoides besseyi]
MGWDARIVEEVYCVHWFKLRVAFVRLRDFPHFDEFLVFYTTETNEKKNDEISLSEFLQQLCQVSSLRCLNIPMHVNILNDWDINSWPFPLKFTDAAKHINLLPLDPQMPPNSENEVTELLAPPMESDPKSTKSRGPVVFKIAHFECRQSILTNQWNGPSGLVFNFFLAAFILCSMGTIFHDTFVFANPVHHLWLIWWNFRQLPQTMFVWSLMFGSTILFIYHGMRLWSTRPSKEVSIQTQWPFLVAYIGYLLALFFLPLRFLYIAELNCACSFVITCENTRLAMKVHSFVRENFARCSQHKIESSRNDAKSQQLEYPTLKQFLYHSFAPTFIYRDFYPMAEKRDWRIVGRYFVHCLGAIYVVNLMFIDFVQPTFQSVDYKKSTISEIIYLLFPAIIPGSMSLLMLFYGLLHCWQNMFAELLRFGDRQFYSNWWNSKNMAEYYRHWNLVVHEWLYAYIYRDIAKWTGTKRGRQVGQILVFFLSAAFHEYWFGVSLRLFYPIMFNLYFVCGGIFFVISRLVRSAYIWNVMMWFNLMIGCGMFVSCYATEWYARQQCSPYFENAILDVVVPRLWTCKLN